MKFRKFIIAIFLSSLALGFIQTANAAQIPVQKPDIDITDVVDDDATPMEVTKVVLGLLMLMAGGGIIAGWLFTAGRTVVGDLHKVQDTEKHKDFSATNMVTNIVLILVAGLFAVVFGYVLIDLGTDWMGGS